VIVAVDNVHDAALEQPVNGNRPTRQAADLGEAGLGISQVLEGADVVHGALLDDGDGVIKVPPVVVYLLDDRDEAVVSSADENLAGVDRHDVGMLEAGPML